MNDYPHRIRLRGPWDFQPLIADSSDLTPLPPPTRMTMPCRWGVFAGRARFRRRFGFPNRLDFHERAWLTFDGVETTASIWLNGHEFGRHARGPFEFDVTSLLQPRNELLVEVEGPADGGLWGEVALEVRCSAFLRGVVCHWEGERLRVAGDVVGSAERTLELYVLLDGATVSYGTIDPTPEGRRFEFLADRSASDRPPTPAGAEVHLRVDLVNAASLWYQFEGIISPDGQRRAASDDRDDERQGV